MKQVTLQKIASYICRIEGKKHEASVGDVREILAILSELIALELETGKKSVIFNTLRKNGKRRLERNQ